MHGASLTRVVACSFALTLGKFGDAKAGVYVSTGDDVTAAQAKREEVSAPDGVPTLIHVDLPLKAGFDEGQIGELSGIIEALISAVPWNQIPLPIYHSHAVDIVDGEQKDTKALRVTLFSSLDMQDLASGLMGQDAGGQPLKVCSFDAFACLTPCALRPAPCAVSGALS
jgi:hypothetical protein